MNARPDQLREEHLTLDEKKARLGLGFRLRQWIAGWLLHDVHLGRVHFGENTISLSSVANVISFSAAGTPASAGDVTAGTELQWHDGSQVNNAAANAEVWLLTGTNTPSANQPMGANKLTGLGAGSTAGDSVRYEQVALLDGSQAFTGAQSGVTPTATGHLTTKGYVDGLVTGLQWTSPALANEYIGNIATRGLVGNAAALTIEGLSPSTGDAYVVSTANGAGALSGATVGDIWEYDGAAWQQIVVGSGGFVPNNTQAHLNHTTALIAPYTDAADENKIAVFAGASLTGTLDTPSDGETMVVEAGIGVGDTICYNSANPTPWGVAQGDSGGFVPAGIKLLVSNSGTLYHPLTAQNGDTATFDGASNDPTLATPLDGDAVLIISDVSVNENKGFVYDDSSGTWVQFAGSGGDHSSLSNLAGDDHAQYALLAGRAGGQSLIGGTGSGDDLNLESTSNATKGDVNIVSGTDVRMLGDNEITPATDNQGSLGISGTRWKEVYATTVVSGDHVFHDTKNDWAYRVKESATGLSMYNEKTGEYMGEIMLTRGGILSRVLAAIGL